MIHFLRQFFQSRNSILLQFGILMALTIFELSEAMVLYRVAERDYWGHVLLGLVFLTIAVVSLGRAIDLKADESAP